MNTDDSSETEPVVSRLNTTTTTPKVERTKNLIIKEQRLIRAIVILVVLMNIPIGRYLLYPFILFSTWVHEMCHGTTAIILGGSIDSLTIHHDGSGLAFTALPQDAFYNLKRVLVASAGYMGTSLVGGVMLIFRKTTKVARCGVVATGALMVLSCLLFVRNAFGLLMLLPMGVGFCVAGCFLRDGFVGELYAFLAVSCCLNAVTSINVLFGLTMFDESDANTVASYMLLPYWFWAFVWLMFSVLMCFLGVVYGVEGSTTTTSSGGGSVPDEEAKQEQNDDPWDDSASEHSASLADRIV